MNVKGAGLAAGVFLCSLLPCSCYREPHRGSYCTSRPAKDKVAGVYGLGDDSVFHKKVSLGSWRKAFLELHTDGNFVMQDMPGWRFAMSDSNTFCIGGIWSGTGEWDVSEGVDRHGRFFRVSLDFEKVNGKEHRIHYPPVLLERDGHYEIMIQIGQEDYEEFLLLHKLAGRP